MTLSQRVSCSGCCGLCQVCVIMFVIFIVRISRHSLEQTLANSDDEALQLCKCRKYSECIRPLHNAMHW